MTTQANSMISAIWDDLYDEHPDLQEHREGVELAFTTLLNSLRDGHQILVCGNGGSAADSEHIAGELAKPCALARPLSDEQRTRLAAEGDDGYLASNLAQGLAVWPLVSQSALLTAIANDQGGDLIFAQQVMAYGRPGDVMWVLSTSGKSRNVLHAVRTARASGLTSLAFTGPHGGAIGELADVTVALPGADTPHIQQSHQLVYHALCLALETAFFG